MSSLDLEINPALDVEGLAKTFAEKGRLHIPEFLTPDSAERLKTAVVENKHWFYTYSDQNGHYETPVEELQNAPREQQAQFYTSLLNFARNNFQYWYSRYALTEAVDRGENPGDVLHDVNAFTNAEPFLNVMRRIVGDEEIALADATASRYASTQFLGAHDDHHDTHDRRAAYVINLTAAWRPDWGGHLVFYDEDGNIIEGLAPTFNTLNIFKTPQNHAVAYVAPFAGAERYAVSGWLRAS